MRKPPEWTDGSANPKEEEAMETLAKRVHTGYVLAVTTSEELPGGVKADVVPPCTARGFLEFLRFMTGAEQAPQTEFSVARAIRACKTNLLEQHPQLRVVKAPPAAGKEDWLETQTKRFGENLSVSPLPKFPWLALTNPMATDVSE